MSQQYTGGSVIVIGAGIIGIACAHYLAAEGRQVTVIDKGSVADGCSYGNCGHILPSHVLPLNSPDAIKNGVLSFFNASAPFRIKPQLKLSFVNWMLQFARYCSQQKILKSAARLKSILDSSFQEFESLLDGGVVDCEWNKCGTLYVYHSQKAFESFEKKNDLLTREFGVSAKKISGNDLANFEPSLKSGLAGGYFYEQDAVVHPSRLATVWARQLQNDGVEFIENCEVTSLEKQGNRIKSVITSKGVFKADEVVLSAGAYSPSLAKEFECAIPVLPGKGYSLTIARPGICPKMSMVAPENNVAITPFEDGLRLGSMMEFVGFNAELPAFRMRQLEECGTTYLHMDKPVIYQEEWFGWRPMTWDSLPIIGRAPNLSNALIATGHCMMGLMLAPATGRLVAEMIGERPTHIPSAPFSPARFN
ncbi:FAD-dependent oxidoreductase [Hyphococcus flavus]|uniref:FAD-dependent oxidoreductase n=1 Tax=Hyphococcus flavus TaxID=1866326 RepID=A0AAE9Z9W2_9PROT|nr:FAD-dependent oxidoreductase [Hyphococcus flavus]WDI30128.1 FAD-dependent oxidoreductase [Hyphococcus flavus]